jgi:large subunit ribosomal protein L23
MKFNFFKKIWGKKEKPEEEKPEEEKEEKKEVTFEPYRGIDFKILPLITEKTLRLAKENKYTFLVEPKVNKKQIKSAIEKIFNVKVVKVRTMNYKKRIRGLTKIKSTRPRFKKAIVQLQSGQTISIFE